MKHSYKREAIFNNDTTDWIVKFKTDVFKLTLAKKKQHSMVILSILVEKI